MKLGDKVLLLDDDDRATGEIIQVFAAPASDQVTVKWDDDCPTTTESIYDLRVIN